MKHNSWTTKVYLIQLRKWNLNKIETKYRSMEPDFVRVKNSYFEAFLKLKICKKINLYGIDIFGVLIV